MGDSVWVRQKIRSQQKGRIWQHTATIHAVRGNASYRLCWGKDGGYDTAEKPFSVSLHFWSGQDLKPRSERSPEPVDSESDQTYKDDEDDSDDIVEKVVEKVENEEEESSATSPLPSPPQKKRIAKRKHQENKGAPRDAPKKPGEAVMTAPDIDALLAKMKPKPSLCTAFAEIGVEKVDSSLRARKAKKARTN